MYLCKCINYEYSVWNYLMNKLGFTLWEACAVVSQIGVLASLLFPTFWDASETSAAIRLGENGRVIVQSIIMCNIERVVESKSTVWPVKGKYKSSNEYFHELLDNSILELSTGTFAGGGVKPANDIDDIKNNGVVWNMLSGIETAPDELPFIYTRNLKGLTETDLKVEDTFVSTDWKEKLDGAIKPFGDKHMVFVTKGGVMVVVKAKDLTDVSFMNGATNVADIVEVVEAKYNDL